MNRILIFDHEWDQKSTIKISDNYRLNHIREVIQPRVGDHLKICLVNRGLAQTQVISCNDKLITLKVIDQTPGHHAWFKLEIGLSRPLTCKKVLEIGTSLGVSHFSFFHAELSEKSYASSKLFCEGGAQKAIRDGLSLSGVYYREPKIQILEPNQFPDSQEEQKYFLSLKTKKSLCEENLNFKKPIVLAVGPERDWIEKEEQTLIKRKYQPISVAPSILRVETATCVALGQLHLLSMQTQC